MPAWLELNGMNELPRDGGETHCIGYLLVPHSPFHFRAANWIERLHIEESAATFDMARCERSGFQFINGHARLLRDSIRRADVSESVSMGGVLDEVDGPSEPWPEEGLVPELAFSPTDQFLTAVTLEGIGPKLLVSEYSTAQKPVLRWRLELRGNNAVEFGVCPASLQDQPKALHKCFECQNGVRPSGFCSAITVGSLLPVKLPLMRGSVVEILLSKSRLSYIVTNPPNGTEMTWHNAVTVPKPYKGPREFRFETDLDSGEVPMKLAITCWARAQFDVLHHHLPYDSGELDVGHEIQVQEHQEYAV